MIQQTAEQWVFVVTTYALTQSVTEVQNAFSFLLKYLDEGNS